MLQSNKLKLLTTTLLVSLTLCGCDLPRSINDFFGKTRTVPDGASVQFGKPQPPVLNPGGAGPYRNIGVNPNVEVMTPPIPAAVVEPDASAPPASNAAAVPVSNPAPYSNTTPQPYAAPNQGMRRTPVENVPGPTSLNIFPGSRYLVTASTLELAAEVSTVAVSQDDADSGIPSLASVPPVPEHPPMKETTAQFKSLTSQRDASESSRQALMNDRGAAVMTSPQTGQLVDDAATVPMAPPVLAAPSESTAFPPPSGLPSSDIPEPMRRAEPPHASNNENDGGFNSWLSSLTGSKDTTSVSNTRHAPVGNLQPSPDVANLPPASSSVPNGPATSDSPRRTPAGNIAVLSGATSSVPAATDTAYPAQRKMPMENIQFVQIAPTTTPAHQAVLPSAHIVASAMPVEPVQSTTMIPGGSIQANSLQTSDIVPVPPPAVSAPIISAPAPMASQMPPASSQPVPAPRPLMASIEPLPAESLPSESMPSAMPVDQQSSFAPPAHSVVASVAPPAAPVEMPVMHVKAPAPVAVNLAPASAPQALVVAKRPVNAMAPVAQSYIPPSPSIYVEQPESAPRAIPVAQPMAAVQVPTPHEAVTITAAVPVAPAPVAIQVSAPPRQQMATLTPVTLHAPAQMDNSAEAFASAAPAAGQPSSNIPATSVHLVPPVAVSSAAALATPGRMLADSRYASRRMRNPDYDDN